MPCAAKPALLLGTPEGRASKRSHVLRGTANATVQEWQHAFCARRKWQSRGPHAPLPRVAMPLYLRVPAPPLPHGGSPGELTPSHQADLPRTSSAGGIRGLPA